MDELIRQAPLNMDDKTIKEIYEKNGGNYMNSLMELWDLKDVKKENKHSEWDEIRETCDVFDGEMNKLMSKLRVKNV